MNESSIARIISRESTCNAWIEVSTQEIASLNKFLEGMASELGVSEKLLLHISNVKSDLDKLVASGEHIHNLNLAIPKSGRLREMCIMHIAPDMDDPRRHLVSPIKSSNERGEKPRSKDSEKAVDTLQIQEAIRDFATGGNSTKNPMTRLMCLISYEYLKSIETLGDTSEITALKIGTTDMTTLLKKVNSSF